MSRVEVVCQLDFGHAGNAEPYLGPGWSDAGPVERRTGGDGSELWLENPGAANDYILELELAPDPAGDASATQRLSIAVRGFEIARWPIAAAGNFAWRIPANLLQAPGPVRIVFSYPNAPRPADFAAVQKDRTGTLGVRAARLLRVESGAQAGAALMSQAPLQLPDDRLVAQFEAMGADPEFSRVQRRCGSEPCGLLQFASIDLPDLVQAVRFGFAGLVDDGNLFVESAAVGSELLVRDRTYGVTYHSSLCGDEITPGELLIQCSRHIRPLVGTFAEAESGKFFVVKRNKEISEAEILPLYAALRARGPHSLLWVVPSNAAHSPGSAKRVLPGLIKGHIDRFAPPEGPYHPSIECWLQLCRTALALNSRSA
jgi:hypothetical protein